MKLRKFSRESFGEIQFKSFYLNLGSSKKGWNSRIKPYLKEVKKLLCFFDLNLSLILMKQSLNVLSFLCSNGQLPWFKYTSNFWKWIFFLSDYRYLSPANLILFVDLLKVSSLTKEKGCLVLSLDSSKKDKNLYENLGILSSVSPEEVVEGVDYPVLGNFKSYYGKTLFYSVFTLIFFDHIIENRKKKKFESLKKPRFIKYHFKAWKKG